jgi:MFS family permease
MNYNKLNNLAGWGVFLIATIVYFLTIEDTVSLWDCGEYITAASKLEVGHPPGAPLFMVLGRLFSFFAEPEMIPVWINRLSALSSSFTILFMYWSITMLGKKLMRRRELNWSFGDQIAVIGAGIIGSLAYTFSDSFWFSAVEGEVYAMSSLFTAAIFWAILKWDAEMTETKLGEITDGRNPLRWFILIWFLFGLAIGVHLLGLLVVPSIAFVIYFQMWEKTTLKGILLTGVISIFVLGFVQEGIIPGLVALASSFEVGFVNSFGLPFFAGTLFFFVLLVLGFLWGFRYAKRKVKPLLSTGLWSLLFLLIGYGSFSVIVIRSNANTPLDENDPENLVTLHAYLKREQYGSWPIMNGPYWNSKENDRSLWKDRSSFFLRRFVVEKNDVAVKTFKFEKDAQAFAKASGPRYSVTEKYFSTNENFRKNSEPTYEQSTFLPRMYYTGSENDPKIAAYKDWSNYDPTNTTTDIGKDGLPLPTFSNNLTYLFSYQVNWMYWRYFMWNFSGRQNDIQGHGDELRGNWISGFSAIDDARLGDQSNAPFYTTENPANNKFWLLPLVFAVMGMIFHFYRSPKEAFVVFLTFFFTGIAIVIYLNQKPYEPRERDYAYAASFYAFAFWIGFGVLAMYDAYKNWQKKDWVNMLKGYGFVSGGLLLFAFGFGSVVFTTWIMVAAMGLVFLGLGYILRKPLGNAAMAGGVITLIGAVVPFIMGNQGWDDHDRSLKTSAHDLAYNYLYSCAPNGIIFTAGDNDTFPLWYLQEVEEKRTDVRVCNTSLFDTDWYTNQMKMQAYESAPLPIKFTEDQILQYAGGTDQVLFMSTVQLLNSGVNRDKVEQIFNSKKKSNHASFMQSYEAYRTQALAMMDGVKAKDATLEPRIAQIRASMMVTAEDANLTTLETMENGIGEVFEGYRNQMLDANVESLQKMQETMMTWEDNWAYLPIKEAMEFVRDDNNIISQNGNSFRVFPTTGFIIPVNKENVLKSGLIEKSELSKVEDTVRFKFDSRSTSYITKSDVMIMDMLANNDWKRAMYFSSPGNTDVSTALYRSGYLRTNGMAWEIAPIRSRAGTPLNEELMYKHLMETYHYGAMSNPDVLTDYYARRQTVQFRTMFAQLAEYYVVKAEEMEQTKSRYGSMLPGLRASGQTRVADSIQNVIDQAGSKPAEFRKKAIKILLKSLEVMPANVVLDLGEMPNPTGSPLTDADGNQYSQYHEGVLQDYVQIFYRAGDKKNAEKLGNEVARQLETIFTYFVKSDARFAGKNSKDFTAAMLNYVTLFRIANDPKIGDTNGAFASRLSKQIETLYNVDLPRIYQELDQMAMENAETRGTGYYYGMLAILRGTMNAIDHTYQITGAAPTNMPANSGLPQGLPMDEAVLNEENLMTVADSDETN